MVKVVLRQEAIDDLNDIWNYTYEKWSEKQADKYYATIKLACKGIGDNPEVGKEYFGVIEKLLGLKSGKYIIFHNLKSRSWSHRTERNLSRKRERVINAVEV